MYYIDELCTILSSIGAYLSFRYKGEIHEKLKSIGVREYYVQFNLLSRDFVNTTRSKKWYKGIDPDKVINPLSNIVNDFGRISVFIADEVKREKLKGMMKSLHTHIQRYEYPDEQTSVEKEATNELIVQISFELGAESSSRITS